MIFCRLSDSRSISSYYFVNDAFTTSINNPFLARPLSVFRLLESSPLVNIICIIFWIITVNYPRLLPVGTCIEDGSYQVVRLIYIIDSTHHSSSSRWSQVSRLNTLFLAQFSETYNDVVNNQLDYYCNTSLLPSKITFFNLRPSHIGCFNTVDHFDGGSLPQKKLCLDIWKYKPIPLVHFKKLYLVSFLNF